MYRRILVPVGHDEASHAGVREAVRLARQSGAQLRFVHAADARVDGLRHPGFLGTPEEALALMRCEGLVQLDLATCVAASSGVRSSALFVPPVGSRPCEAILDEARRWEADVIVAARPTAGGNDDGVPCLADEILATTSLTAMAITPGRADG